MNYGQLVASHRMFGTGLNIGSLAGNIVGLSNNNPVETRNILDGCRPSMTLAEAAQL